MISQRIDILVLVLLTLFVLTGCGENDPAKGKNDGDNKETTC